MKDLIGDWSLGDWRLHLEDELRSKDMAKRTIAYWIRTFGFTIDLWNAHTGKFGQANLFVSCIGPDKSEHEFYF